MCCTVNILVRELSRITFKRLLKVRKVLFLMLVIVPWLLHAALAIL